MHFAGSLATDTWHVVPEKYTAMLGLLAAHAPPITQLVGQHADGKCA
jgi:hypothetical protein